MTDDKKTPAPAPAPAPKQIEKAEPVDVNAQELVEKLKALEVKNVNIAAQMFDEFQKRLASELGVGLLPKITFQGADMVSGFTIQTIKK